MQLKSMQLQETPKNSDFSHWLTTQIYDKQTKQSYKSSWFQSLMIQCFSFLTCANCCEVIQTPRIPKIIPPQLQNVNGKKTLVIDLDETLIHSSFDPLRNADFILNIFLSGQEYTIYVAIRPGSREFIKLMSTYYELIVFTASISEYAEPIIDYLDPSNVISHKLFRENCSIVNDVLVKDLSTLNRPLNDVIIIDNCPKSATLQPQNYILIQSFFEDQHDRELQNLVPFLVAIQDMKDIRPIEEWFYKFTHFNRFAYVNKRGQKAYYEIANDVIEEREECNTQQSPEKPRPRLQRLSQQLTQLNYQIEDDDYFLEYEIPPQNKEDQSRNLKKQYESPLQQDNYIIKKSEISPPKQSQISPLRKEHNSPLRLRKIGLIDPEVDPILGDILLKKQKSTNFRYLDQHSSSNTLDCIPTLGINNRDEEYQDPFFCSKLNSLNVLPI